MSLEICYDCEKTFEAGPTAKFCPDCLKKRLSRSAKKRNLNRLGIEARRNKGDRNNGSHEMQKP